MIQVVVNGDGRDIPEGLTLAGLLDHLGIDPRMVVVEHNKEIVRRPRLGEVAVGAGDQVEIVQFVGGG
jgi:sulfur carrier protein